MFSSPVVENSYTFFVLPFDLQIFCLYLVFKCFNQNIHPYFRDIFRSYTPDHNHPNVFLEIKEINLPRFRLA